MPRLPHSAFADGGGSRDVGLSMVFGWDRVIGLKVFCSASLLLSSSCG